MPLLDASQWDAFLSHHPYAHLLQSSAWGLFKDEFGWSPAWVQSGDAGAQVLFRRLPLGFSVAYIPKGPVGESWDALWPEIDRLCRAKRAVFLLIEPDAWEDQREGISGRLVGFAPDKPVQPHRTIVISLDGTEEDWLARMKQKTRYNIRLAERKGVVVRESGDVSAFYRLMETTGQRDKFGVHAPAYYRRVYEIFAARGQCSLLNAEYEGRPLAMLMAFAQGQRGWYFYGASSDEERNRMPTYLLQWEAMRWAAGKGCAEYDLWGVPDVNEEALEAGFTDRADGLWGVYRFKRGFGGELKRSAGAWRKVYLPGLYKLYGLYASRRGAEEHA